MSISATARKLSPLHRLILLDLAAALFCALFGAVYERFSHQVYSYRMLYAFAFPLILGVLPLYLLEAFRAPLPDSLRWGPYHGGIAALTVGSLVSGALEIYGTSSPLTVVYWIAGEALLLFGALLFVSRLVQSRQKKARRDRSIPSLPVE